MVVIIQTRFLDIVDNTQFTISIYLLNQQIDLTFWALCSEFI